MLFFISDMKFEILGPDAEELMDYTLTRNVKKLSVGQIVYSSMCYENGSMFDDGTLLKMSDHGFRWVCGDEYAGEWLKEQAKKKKFNVSYEKLIYLNYKMTFFLLVLDLMNSLQYVFFDILVSKLILIRI